MIKRDRFFFPAIDVCWKIGDHLSVPTFLFRKRNCFRTRPPIDHTQPACSFLLYLFPLYWMVNWLCSGMLLWTKPHLWFHYDNWCIIPIWLSLLIQWYLIVLRMDFAMTIEYEIAVIFHFSLKIIQLQSGLHEGKCYWISSVTVTFMSKICTKTLTFLDYAFLFRHLDWW